jgi:hypothetical protein
MATADTEASTTPAAGWLRRTWEKAATILAVIGLIDLSSQLIHWAALIHWIVTKYAAVRTCLFGWLPFHIPPDWHDPIVLFSILLSVTNVGIYRETGWRIRSFWKAVNNSKFSALLFGLLALVFFPATAVVGGVILHYVPGLFPFFDNDASEIHPMLLAMGVLLFLLLFILSESLGAIVVLALFVLVMAFSVAWRWLLATAAIFGALVIVNQVYVLWLESLAAD